MCPGVIKTSQTQQFADSQGLNKEDVIKQIAASIPMKRVGQLREVTQAILFLASDKASYITATPLLVDGGYTAQ